MAVDKQTLGAAIAVCGSGGGGGSVGAYTFKGSVATYDDLPTLGNEVGDIYDVRDTGANYAWTGTAWDALGQIVDVQALEDEIDGKVDKVTGKGLSTNDYTTAEKEKLAGIEAGAEVNTITGVKGDSESSYRTGNVNITKANIGLGNVDNTADVDKPVSTAQQTALDLKLDKANVYNALDKTAEGYALDARQGKVLNDSISSLSKNELLINEIVPNTTQSATFDAITGNLSTVTHIRNSVAIRTDVYTYGANTITEVRTLNTGESITITTNTTTNTTIVA